VSVKSLENINLLKQTYLDLTVILITIASINRQLIDSFPSYIVPGLKVKTFLKDRTEERKSGDSG